MHNIEDIYELSHTQQGMLFHTLYAPESGMYVEQLSCTLQGTLDVAAFQYAWQQVVNRHPPLRASFVWEDLEKPVQIIHAQAELPWTVLDWRTRSPEARAIEFEAFLEVDRRQGFDLEHPPLMRCALMRETDDTYRFVWSSHHLLMDGWSLPIVLHDVFTSYTNPGRRLPAPRPYRDYIAWLQQQDLAEAEAFWRKTLHGFTAPTQLVVDRNLTSALSPGTILPQVERLVLSKEMTATLQAFAQRYHITLNTLIQGAWAILLSRYSSETDIVFGMTVSGRPPDLPGAEAMVGLFINTLPVRVQISPDAAPIPWLQALQAQQTELRHYEYSPLVQIQNWSKIPHGTPLFESMIAFENYPVDISLHKIGADLKIEDVRMLERTNYALTVGVIPGTELLIQINYDAARFEVAAIRRMAGHLQTLLAGMIADITPHLSEFPLLTDDERHRILVEWNETTADYPSDKCIHELFEAQTEQTPDAIAVIMAHAPQTRNTNHQTNQITYRELNARANQLARYLQKFRVGPEVLVGVCIERSLETIVGLLGILKAGGAYVPLDPTYPQERLAFMLDDTNAPLLLTQKKLLSDLPAYQGKAICLDTDWEIISRENPENLISGMTQTNLAYVIYTSGSTGKPKGVLIEHAALVNHCHTIRRHYQITPEDYVLQFASFSFDTSLEQIFSALIGGARVVMRGKELWTAAECCQILVDFGITVINLPPAYWYQLIQEWRQQPALFAQNSLRLVIIGGDVLFPEMLDLWRQLPADSIRLLNAYGPTETTITASTFEVAPGNASFSTIPIGRPLTNRTIYILDAFRNPVPVGVPGEVHIGGTALARSYLHCPELTSEKFILDPFRTQPGSRLYVTGDRARYLSDGVIEFLGRLDNQLKIRGFRIEPGEIETCLRQHPAVRDAAVVTRQTYSQEKQLCAYIISEQATSPNAGSSVRQHDRIELWPSVGEYPVYDELLYHAMTHDEARNERYKAAIKRLVKDKVVVDVGTGRDAILARFCVEAGARKVYGLEIDHEAYQQAVACVQKLDLTEKVAVMYGDVSQVQLPELADVCVSEIIGTIGGSEGVGVILNAARKLLKSDGLMIPQKSLTHIAAVCLPEDVLHNPGFTEVTGHYVRQVFDTIGYPFDIRLCIKKFPKSQILSNVETFEELYLTKSIATAYHREILLTINTPSTCHGFLLWLRLHTIEGEVIDVLEKEHCWLPVYFPIFDPGIDVMPGDTIRAICSGKLSDDGLHPDYTIEGEFIRNDGTRISFRHESCHHERQFRHSPFYQRLFAQDDVGITRSENIVQDIRYWLTGILPDYMVPAHIVMLDALPLTPSGKIDRLALLEKHEGHTESQRNILAPRTAAEKLLVKIWAEVLQFDEVGVGENFFELGGHSLSAVQLVGKIREYFGLQVTLRELFQAPTIAQLARTLNRQETSNAFLPLVPLQPHGNASPILFVHPGDGNILCYRELAQQLPTSRPVYGLQAFGIEPETIPLADVQDMAAQYIETLLSAFPTGPYLLGGFCTGGIIAYEMAQQLRQHGKHVPILLLLDTQAPCLYTPFADDVQSFMGFSHDFGGLTGSDIVSVYHRVRNLEPETGFAGIRQDLQSRSLQERLTILLECARHAGKFSADIDTDYFERAYHVYSANSRAIMNYQPQPYSGQVVLVRALNGLGENLSDQTLGWGQYASRIEVKNIAGNHFAMLRPPRVEALANLLTRFLTAV